MIEQLPSQPGQLVSRSTHCSLPSGPMSSPLYLMDPGARPARFGARHGQSHSCGKCSSACESCSIMDLGCTATPRGLLPDLVLLFYINPSYPALPSSLVGCKMRDTRPVLPPFHPLPCRPPAATSTVQYLLLHSSRGSAGGHLLRSELSSNIGPHARSMRSPKPLIKEKRPPLP